MIHSLVHFSTLAAGLLAEDHPPAEMMSSFNFGLAPIGVVIVVLLVILVAWIALNTQAGRADLHAVAEGGHHEDAHAHEGH